MGSPVQGALFGDGFFNRAKFFEEVYANSNAGGDDRAYLNDSSGDDDFQASASRALLSNDSSASWLYGFEYVRSTADNGGSDKAELAAVDYVLELRGYWD